MEDACLVLVLSYNNDMSYFRRFLKISTLFCAVLTCSSCVTSRLHDIEKIRMGMEKDQVLETTGGPTRAQRWHGQDRWTYVFKDHESTTVREIRFMDGKVVYVGGEYVPPVAAEERDRLNEESNHKAEADWKEEIAKNKSRTQRFFEEGIDESDQPAAAPGPSDTK